MFTDTSEHYRIYQIIHGYSIGVYDKTETKSKLQNVDLSDLDTFIDSIKTTITDIINADSIKDRNITDKIAVVKKQKNRNSRNNKSK